MVCNDYLANMLKEKSDPKVYQSIKGSNVELFDI